MDIHHVQLAMPARQGAIAETFYTGILGMTKVPKPATLAGRGGVWFESGNVRVHLGVEEPFIPARKAHPPFVVASLDSAVAHFKAKGLQLKPGADLPGIRRVFVDDPFGNRIEIMEMIEG